MMNLKKDYEECVFYGIRICKKDVANIIILVLGIILITLETIEVLNNSSVMNYKIIIYYVLIIASIIGSNFFNFLNKRNAIKKEIEIKQLKLEVDNLQELCDSLRCFKHDFNNIIQAIDGYISLNNMEALHTYFKSLWDECTHLNMLDSLGSKISGNPAIYGVLLNKLKIAKENNIQLNVEVMENLNKLDGKSYVVARMLGILLDNALEASNDCKEKIVNVQILPRENAGSVIIVENTYVDKHIDTGKIFEKNFTTKADKGNSGLGLWKIQDILEKDSTFELLTTKSENMFKQELEICS